MLLIGCNNRKNSSTPEDWDNFKEAKMKHNNCYVYPKTVREAINGERHYVAGQEKLPSVTTILSGTQDAEKAQSLQKWRDRVGEAKL